MPKVFVIEDDSLKRNLPVGINDSSYSLTFSRGIINKLDDEELEGVAAHELTHIRKPWYKAADHLHYFRGYIFLPGRNGIQEYPFLQAGSRARTQGLIILVVLVVIRTGLLFFPLLLRFGISRSREYMADAGFCRDDKKKPYALASALQKNSGWSVQSKQYTAVMWAQLFINNPTPVQTKSICKQPLLNASSYWKKDRIP